jgi:chromosome segregation ATPase
MSDTFWDPEALARSISKDQPQDASEKPATLAVSANDFDALEERIYRAVELVKNGRQAGASAESRLAEWESRAVRAEAQLQAQQLVVEQLESELRVLRGEREEVRQRMERVLKQLDVLEM